MYTVCTHHHRKVSVNQELPGNATSLPQCQKLPKIQFYGVRQTIRSQRAEKIGCCLIVAVNRIVKNQLRPPILRKGPQLHCLVQGTHQYRIQIRKILLYILKRASARVRQALYAPQAKSRLLPGLSNALQKPGQHAVLRYALIQINQRYPG